MTSATQSPRRTWPVDRERPSAKVAAPSRQAIVAAGLAAATATCADLARLGCVVRAVRVDHRGAVVTIAPPPAYARLHGESVIRDQDGQVYRASARDVTVQWTERDKDRPAPQIGDLIPDPRCPQRRDAEERAVRRAGGAL